jgi:hypothetical protein
MKFSTAEFCTGDTCSSQMRERRWATASVGCSFSANGAASLRAWGIAPGIRFPQEQALKARFTPTGFVRITNVTLLKSARNFSGQFGLFLPGPSPNMNTAPLALTIHQSAEVNRMDTQRISPRPCLSKEPMLTPVHLCAASICANRQTS